MTAPIPTRASAHRLFLLRHADAVGWAANGDRERPLSAHGRDQAHEAGTQVRQLRPAMVWTSPARRARETAEQLGSGHTPELQEGLYHATADSMLGMLRALPEKVESILLVAHAPGIPDLAWELASKDSDGELRRLLERGFPTCTLVGLEFTGRWSELSTARLRLVRRSSI